MIKQIRLDGGLDDIETQTPPDEQSDEKAMIEIFQARQDIGGGLTEKQAEYLFPRLARKYHFQRSLIDGKIYLIPKARSTK